MGKGSLVISLDFELVWGVFDHIALADKVTYFDATLAVIPRIIAAFDAHNVAATWATVGMLFNENWEAWHANKPDLLPTYATASLDAYAFGQQHQKSGLDRFFFAPHLIRMLQQAQRQEIGTHTYSHYYCLEKGQEKVHFEADLQAALHVAQQLGVTLQSLVFPRNQFNKDYLAVCAEKGILTVRSNPDVWYWNALQPATLATKIFRTADAYLPLEKKAYSQNSLVPDLPLCQPASRFLRPQQGVAVLNRLRLERIKKEIVAAAQKGEVYHLWWHPHNFGVDSDGSMQALQEILTVYKHCSETYGMESLSMREICSRVKVREN